MFHALGEFCRSVSQLMATGARFPKTIVFILWLVAPLLMAAASSVVAQAEVPEVIRENPNRTALIGMAGVAIPAFFGWLGKRAEAKGALLTTKASNEAIVNNRTIQSLAQERDRLLATVEKQTKELREIDKDRDSAKEDYYALLAQYKALEERLSAKNSRIRSLGRRLAELGHPVTENPEDG